MPFPVNAPFRVRADLARLLGEGDAPPRLLQSDAAYPACARIKRAHLDDPERPLTRVLPGSDPRRLIGALGAALAAIARSQPEVAGAVQPPASPRSGSAGSDAGEGEAAGGRFVLRRAALQLVLEPEVRVTALMPAADPVADRLAGLPPVARALAAFSLAVQEDLVLMGWPDWPAGHAGAGAPDPGLIALGLSVVFPSGWDPADKLGKALWAIHAPVAEGAALRQSSPALSRAMVDKGPFERHVWTLAADAQLARWPEPSPSAGSSRSAQGAAPAGPGEALEATAAAAPFQPARPAPPRDLSDIVFRCERQVTLGLPAFGAALFLIRVHVAPLLTVCADPRRRALLVASLRSMSDEVVAYKNLQRLRERVLAAWT